VSCSLISRNTAQHRESLWFFVLFTSRYNPSIRYNTPHLPVFYQGTEPSPVFLQAELSRLLRKLFEDNAAGLISESAMLKAYQDEQAETAEKLKIIATDSAQKEDYRVNAEKLRETILECLNIEKLTPFILNKLIERTEIGHLQTVDGQRQQEVTIVWKFCGEIQ
jgi:hypothetical protein